MTAWCKAGLGPVLLSIAGCASAADNGERSPAPLARSSLPPVALVEPVRPASVVAKLRFREVDLVITRAETGPRFAVVARGGTPLGADLDEARLRKDHPDLYSAYRFGLAQGAFLDARLDLPREKHRSKDGF